MCETHVKIQDEVLWVETLCSDVVGYQRFGETCCFHLQSEKCGASIGIQVVVFWVVVNTNVSEKLAASMITSP